LTPLDAQDMDKAFLAKLRGGADSVPVSDKRVYLKAVGERLRRHGTGSLTPDGAEAVRLLAQDDAWQARQDVAELLVLLPEDLFIPIISKLTKDPNGYVKRSAEQSLERRRTAASEAKRASRGDEEIEKLYQSLTKQIGGEMADKAIQLGEKRFFRMVDFLVHDLLSGYLAGLTEDARKLQRTLAKTDHDGAASAEQVVEGLKFLAQYLREVEAYSKSLPVTRHPEWIKEMTTQAGELARRAFEELGYDSKGIALDDSGVRDVRVEVSRELIVQAMANLLKNAFESFVSPAGEVRTGRIALTTETKGNQVVIRLKDDGCGLPENELVALRAFLPGRKNNHKKRSKGLGLLTAKKNIEAHDGTIKVESTLGEGLTVTITIPISAGTDTSG